MAKLCLILTTPWTVTHPASLPVGFPRQEYWSMLPFPPPRDLSEPQIEPASPTLAGGFFTTGRHRNLSDTCVCVSLCVCESLSHV